MGCISSKSTGFEGKGATNERASAPAIERGRRKSLEKAGLQPPLQRVPQPPHDSAAEVVKPLLVKGRKTIADARVQHGTERLLERYNITETVLGTGISGAVRVVENKITKKRFALKVLNLENISPKKAAMLHNEVEIYLKLDHPNIARLLEVFEDEKNIFLIMELCTGRELYDRLASRRVYTERDTACVAEQMLEAINYCHKHHICHRDLKLENWVYSDESPDAQLKLIDFGFSRIFNPIIPMTAMHGTVYYVSPEVMDGCYRETCDIWSIGVIVYMLLAGSPPFNGAVDYEILIKIRAAKYSFDGPAWANVSQEAKNFISHLLVKDPNKRPSAAEALEHPWLKNSNQEVEEIDPQVLQAMRQFALGNVMKRAALGLIAYSMSTSEVKDLYKEFKKLDKDKSGTIRLHDLVQVLQERLSLSAQEAESIFDKLDQTGDREVHYSEFLATTLQAKTILSSDWMTEAFVRFDVQHQGYIDIESLRANLGDSYNGTAVEEILASCHQSVPGQLNYEDFVEALTRNDDDALDVWQRDEKAGRKQTLTDAVVRGMSSTVFS